MSVGGWPSGIGVTSLFAITETCGAVSWRARWSAFESFSLTLLWSPTSKAFHSLANCEVRIHGNTPSALHYYRMYISLPHARTSGRRFIRLRCQHRAAKVPWWPKSRLWHCCYLLDSEEPRNQSVLLSSDINNYILSTSQTTRAATTIAARAFALFATEQVDLAGHGRDCPLPSFGLPPGSIMSN